LTVHRRRLHLLPLLDKINDDDDKPQTTSNSKEKEKVKRIFWFLFFLILQLIFSLNVNMLVIYVNDVFHVVKNLLHIYLKYINLEKQ